MSRESKPWYYQQVGCYYCWLNGRKTKLLKASESDRNLRKSKAILADLLYESRHNILQVPSEQTVASIIDAYLADVAPKEGMPKIAKGTLAMRKPFLQSFAEFTGWRKIDESFPEHMTDWLDAHPAWESDWTKNTALRCVQTVFNWAAKKKSRKIRH